MKKIAEKICEHKKLILIISSILFVISFIGMYFTNINYDILVYLPEDIETVKGQNILTNDFNMGAYSVVVAENLSSKEILKLEENIKNVSGVNEVISAYDVIGTTIPIDVLPSEIIDKFHQDNTDLMFIAFKESTSSINTINAIEEIKDITSEDIKISGMSAMVLDTMNLSDKEIVIYIIIAVILCLLVLELSLNSYLVPILLLVNIGMSIIFNMGSNIFLGEISYITKALVAVLQLGVTTDFSIFLYHSYENKKNSGMNNKDAMVSAICETFTSVTGSSLTTIAGFLVLCTMNLTLGKDLGIVMAKGVFLGVICVLTVFPSLLLVFDKWCDKTKHKKITLNFEKLNKFVIKHYKVIFAIFLILLIPAYLANKKVDIYYKIDESLPDTLDSIVANTELKEKFNIVSPEIILIDKDMKTNKINEMVKEIESVQGIDFVLSFSKLKELGLTENMLPSDIVSVFESENYQMLLLNSTYDIATNELNEQVEIINNIIKKYDENSILAGEGPLMKDLVTISDEDFNNVNYSSIICILIIMIIVLKSVSLPVLLILTIEFAIFVNMSVSYFGGVTLPFVAPIVIGTIQLGATIDYAILMTTTYLNNRKENIEKKEAMLNTLNYCGNSIFVSAMCFFAATFGVGIYSDLEMVGSLCTLISRGAIISMVVVIMVLPSILLIFDKFILKTTLNMKGIDNMKNKNTLKKGISIATMLMLILMPLSTNALEKEEIVYAKLNSDGSEKSVLVNKHLINDKKIDNIEDATELENILNINSDEAYIQNGSVLTWHSYGNDIFYQGISNKTLPVEEVVTYKLDGKVMNIDDILGKSGHVEITIKYKNKDKHIIDGNTLYTPFVVTTGTIINGNNNSNVSVTNGKVINNGSNYIIVGISTPGLYESLDINELKDLDKIKISFDTEKFELGSIYSVIMPKLVGSSDLEIFNKLDMLYESIDTLQSKMNEIEDGSKTILDKLSIVENGSNELSKNLNIVLTKLEEIKNGTNSIDTNLNEIITSLDNVINSFSSSDNLNKIESIKTLINTNQKTIDTLDSTNKLVKDTYEKYNLESLSYSSLENSNKELFNAKYTYENSYEVNENLILLLEKNNEALISSLNTLGDIQTEINTLNGYLKELKNGTSKLNEGTKELYNGIDLLNSKLSELASGSTELKNGMNTLNDGIKTFNNEGINALSKYSNGAKNITEKINLLIKLGDNYKSFDLKQNGVKSSTKFILVVDGKKVKQENVQVIKTKNKESIIDKFINLFK